MRKTRIIVFVLLSIGLSTAFKQQNDDEEVKRIIHETIEKLRGNTSYAEIRISIVRPKWSRDMEMKAWSKGTEYSLTVVTEPVKDRGTVFLKRDKEVWNYLPNVERTIKLPPSMMGQSWMGTDLTNDDLVQQSSLENDFDHKLLRSEMLEGRDCYVISSIPHEDATVVWGMIISWIDKKDLIQMKTEFYDEDKELVNTFTATDIKRMGGKNIATRLAILPSDKPGNKTVMQYLHLEWDKPIPDNFFTVQNMKKVKP